MKRIIGILVAIGILISLNAVCFSSSAKGWKDKAKEVELDTEYELFVDVGNPDYNSVASEGYYVSLKFNVPEDSKIKFKASNEGKLGYDVSIYTEDNLDEQKLRPEVNEEYSTAYGETHAETNFNLEQGNYYMLLDIFDYSDDIRSGECDGSFKLVMEHTALNEPQTSQTSQVTEEQADYEEEQSTTTYSVTSESNIPPMGKENNRSQTLVLIILVCIVIWIGIIVGLIIYSSRKKNNNNNQNYGGNNHNYNGNNHNYNNYNGNNHDYNNNRRF